jgi:hypothetical protein
MQIRDKFTLHTKHETRIYIYIYMSHTHIYDIRAFLIPVCVYMRGIRYVYVLYVTRMCIQDAGGAWCTVYCIQATGGL